VWNGAQLKAARLRRGWSQDELARETRTSVTNISRWERNRNTPSANMIPVLASALEAEEGSFFQSNGSDPDEDDDEADQEMAAALNTLVRLLVERARATREIA
jgi:transcriptional regulator with XRE-family HTH domain